MEPENQKSSLRKGQRRPLTELVGTKVGRLLVLKMLRYEGKSGRLVVLCACDCGIEKEILAQSLRAGLTKSCGCLSLEKSRLQHNARTHGQTRTPIYQVWQNMRRRCEKPTTAGYKHYGGRGIKVCKQWLKFENFYKDMGDRPSREHTLDRVDVDGNYSPKNCRWATREQQQNNKRSNVWIEYKNEKLTLAQWERKLQMKPGVLHMRLKLGVPINIAVTTPTLPRNYDKALRFESRSEIRRLTKKKKDL